MNFVSTNSNDPGPGFTAESFKASLKMLLKYGRSAAPVMVAHPRVIKALDDFRRTIVLKTVGNYSLRALDGKVWWSRDNDINETLDVGSFPRDVAEGYTPWITFNRSQRRHGLPAAMNSYADFRKRFPTVKT